MASSYSNRTRTSCNDALLVGVFKDLTDGLRPSKASNGSIEHDGSDRGSTRWKCRTALPRMLLTLKTLAVGHRDNFTVSVYTFHRPLVICPCFVLSEMSAPVAKSLFSESSVSPRTPQRARRIWDPRLESFLVQRLVHQLELESSPSRLENQWTHPEKIFLE